LNVCWSNLESNLVWLFFGIIKIMYSYIHILPLFDDDNHYQVNSFQHHQNLHDSYSPIFWWWQSLLSEFFSASSKPAWFTFSPFLMMTTICRLRATKKISICIVYSPLISQWLLIWNSWRLHIFHKKKLSHKPLLFYLLSISPPLSISKTNHAQRREKHSAIYNELKK